MAGLREAAAQAMCEPDPVAKVHATAALSSATRIEAVFAAVPVSLVGRPQRPELVDFRRLSRRGYHTPALRAAVVHSVVHIEFNAINLALDAVQRYDNLPEQFYRDWPSKRRATSRCCASDCESLVTNTEIFLLTTGCGRWLKVRTIPWWSAWRWCRDSLKPVALMSLLR